MRQTARTGRSDRQSGFAVIYTALVLTLMLLFGGLATDSLRAYMVKAQLTKAVDGAALGAARMLNGGDPAGQARALFRANFPDAYMGTPAGADPAASPGFYSLTTDEDNGINIIDITATVTMPTMLMSLAQINEVTVKGTAQATRRMVDMCLVLDTSGSIGWRWPYVRDAARAFVNAFDAVSDRFCLVKYSSGAEVAEPITWSRGFNKPAVINAIPNSIPATGFTSMAEGLWRGWDELSTVPGGQQSSLRVLVLFTDGAANGVPGIYEAFPGEARSLNTSDFPEYPPDPDNFTRNSPYFFGLHDTETGVRSPSYTTNKWWSNTWTHSAIPYLPVASFHEHGRGIVPTSFPLETAGLSVGGAPQSAVRGLRNWDSGAGRYPADIWNTNNAARNLVEIIADAARNDSSGDYRIRVYTIGMGELIRYFIGTMPEQPEQMLLRVANDSASPDYNAGQLEGGYFFAATEADVGPAFQELQSQIIRLTQ